MAINKNAKNATEANLIFVLVNGVVLSVACFPAGQRKMLKQDLAKLFVAFCNMSRCIVGP